MLTCHHWFSLSRNDCGRISTSVHCGFETARSISSLSHSGTKPTCLTENGLSPDLFLELTDNWRVYQIV